ncbi:cation transporter [Streptomyces sp. NPDC001728]|uniref:cation transporter n=1 Tax=Streptomyces sp. NPDC001728 TaxID=3154396 RepID=UPI00331F3F4B
MDIPEWFLWVALGMTGLQALGLVPVIRRMRDTDPALRTQGRFDLLDTLGSLLMFVGLMLSLFLTASWAWLSLAGLALVAAVYAVKGARLLRARRRTT